MSINVIDRMQGTNRTLLKWLKLWDQVVFNKERRVRVGKEDDKKKKKDFGNKAGFKKKVPELSEELDKTNRPIQKVKLTFTVKNATQVAAEIKIFFSKKHWLAVTYREYIEVYNVNRLRSSTDLLVWVRRRWLM